MDVVLNLAGHHNVLNALSAIAIAVELNVPDEAVKKALAEFKGVGRRFQSYGDVSVREANGGGKFHGHRRLRPITRSKSRPRCRRREARSRAAAWCWLSSRTATRAPVIASKISSR
jgi:hypothetical protein